MKEFSLYFRIAPPVYSDFQKFGNEKCVLGAIDK